MVSVTAADLDMQNTFYQDEITSGLSSDGFEKYFMATKGNNVILSSSSETIHDIQKVANFTISNNTEAS
jgi:hypothetical protein